MSDRTRALDVLRKARDLLAQRLVEQILEAEERILDDAAGDSYLGDIESLHERFGAKLSHLNQLINAVPNDFDPQPFSTSTFSASDSTSFPSAARDASTPAEIITPQPAAITGPLIVSAPALPAPESGLELSQPSFSRFVEQVRGEDLVDAGKTLGYLFDLSEARGVQCARVFYTRLRGDETFPLKAQRLRREILAGGYNDALTLLAECFGLIGIEALGVLQTLRNRLAANDA